jgi:prephenate dehydrogenase
VCAKPPGNKQSAFQIETRPVNPETFAVQWKKVTLVGVGLLGGSLGLALRQRALAGTVVGFVRRAASISECQDAGAVHAATQSLGEAVAGADLVVLCTPIGQMRALALELVPFLSPGAIVTDVGSVKQCVVRDLEEAVHQAAAFFVGSHPMAGAEKTGVAASRPDLFVNAVCVVTPTPQTNSGALLQVERLWESVGSRLMRLSPEIHDQLVSRSSHLPHLVAAQLASLVLDPASPREQSLLCATGFRDTTRIASGSPEMWRDIALANRENLLLAIDRFSENLQRLKALLRQGDAEGISRFLQCAKERRDSWSSQLASPSPE